MTPRYLVIDFETTCCDHASVPAGEMEVIEMGALCLDAHSLEKKGEFHSFVRPVRHPMLTPFCKQLIHTQQDTIDLAPIFPVVLTRFSQWLIDNEATVVCTWGDYDLKQLRQDCDFHQTPLPVDGTHINLKRVLAEKLLLARQLSIIEALRLAGMDFEGTPHRAIDDARNIARLLPYVVGDQHLPSRPRVERRRR